MARSAPAYQDRVFSAGRVFERGLGTIVRNPAVTLGLAMAIGAVPGLLSSYLFTRLRVEQMSAGALGPRAEYVLYAIILLSWVVNLIIFALTQAVLTRATVAAAQGRRAGIGECLKAAVAVLAPLIALAIVFALVVILGIVLLIVPGAILYVMWSVAIPAMVEERRGVLGSLARSRALTKGVRWKVFGVTLVLLGIYWAVSIVLGLVAVWGYGDGFTNATLEMPLGFVVVSVLVGTLLNVFWGTVQASLFVELKTWKEGGSVEALEEVFA